MSRIIAVAGPSGSGKSTSVRNLPPESTYVISVLNKALPFKGAESAYNSEKKNYFSTEDYQQVVDVLVAVDKKRPEIENIIIDDAGFLMQTEFFKRASEKGYEKFSEIGQHMFKVLNTARHLERDINVFILFHTEEIFSGQIIVGHKIKSIGKLCRA